MNRNIQITVFFLALFIVVIQSFKNDNYSNSSIQKDKLHQYFSKINRHATTKVVGRKQFVLDSLSKIKNNSAQISFVEVSEFTDSLSIRWVTTNANCYSSFMKFNDKNSKHLGTTYISIPQHHNFVNTDLKKVVSTIEFSLLRESKLKNKDALGDYLNKNSKSCKLFYVRGGESVNDISSNLGSSFYQFDHETDHTSLLTVRHLLNKYSFKKFQLLWENGFSRFKEIYGISFEKLTLERKKFALNTTVNKTPIDWEAFNKCI